jgi:hypothetical protein
MRGSDGIVLLRFAQPNHRYPLVSAGQLSAARDQSTQPTLPLDQRPTRERSSSSTAHMSLKIGSRDDGTRLGVTRAFLSGERVFLGPKQTLTPGLYTTANDYT